MRNVDCYQCGSSQATVMDVQDFHDEYLARINSGYLAEKRYWKVCGNCGFIYHTPVLDADDHHALYVDNYQKQGEGGSPSPRDFFNLLVNIPEDKSENHARIRWLAPHLPKGASGGPLHVLDIGCRIGAFLHLFLKAHPGWKAAGVEPTKEYADFLSSEIGIEVAAGNYDSGIFPNKFELITAIDVLEHVSDPVDFFNSVRTDISDDGVFYIEVPDLDDFKNLPPSHDRFMIPHNFYFSENSLRNLCERAGFGIVSVDRFVSENGAASLQALCLPMNGSGHEDVFDDPEEMLSLRRAFYEKDSAENGHS